MHARVPRLFVAFALVGGVLAAIATLPAAANDANSTSSSSQEIEFKLVPSTPAIAHCLPKLKASVEVALTTNQKGFDKFQIEASGLPPHVDFTVFLLQQPGPPFGAAQYSGDFTTDASGRGHNTFNLIVQEAFSSTIVNGNRVRVDLNHVGFWFADQKGDDFCFPGQPDVITPFDGDNQAGVQVMNSANALPGAPLPPP